MTEYITSDNDMLDAICWRQYGREDVVPVVLESNPHLAGLSPMLTAGIKILLPDIPEPRNTPILRLWD